MADYFSMSISNSALLYCWINFLVLIRELVPSAQNLSSCSLHFIEISHFSKLFITYCPVYYPRQLFSSIYASRSSVPCWPLKVLSLCTADSWRLVKTKKRSCYLLSLYQKIIKKIMKCPAIVLLKPMVHRMY